MHLPIYTGRYGSKCYFRYNRDFFNNNKTVCMKLIAFYTLYLFGHQEKCDDILISTATKFKRISLEKCLKLVYKDKLCHRVFHLSEPNKMRLMGYFNGDALVTNDIIKHRSCATERIHDEYPCMYDKFDVGVYISSHVYSCDSDDSDDNETRDKTCLVIKRTSSYDTSVEPCCGKRKPCEFCKISNYINENNFTYRDDFGFDSDTTESITMNNLIFNFRDYNFNIKTGNKNSFRVTFDPKAIGGFKHASIYTGAIFEVHHAIPGSLQHIQTTYVNTINIEYNELGGEIIIVSDYKAIDVL